MKKKLTVEKRPELVSVSITYVCPKDGVTFTQEIDREELLVHSTPCDLCGSHGYIEIDVYCDCGELHEFSLKAW